MAPPGETRSPTVLVVDDDPSVLLLIELALGALEGWNVITTTDPHAALTLARAHRPSVVLLDLRMPHLDGVSVAARLLEDPVTNQTPIVLITAAPPQRGRRPRWAHLAIAGVLEKPFDPMTLGAQLIELASPVRLSERP